MGFLAVFLICVSAAAAGIEKFPLKRLRLTQGLLTSSQHPQRPCLSVLQAQQRAPKLTEATRALSRVLNKAANDRMRGVTQQPGGLWEAHAWLPGTAEKTCLGV